MVEIYREVSPEWAMSAANKYPELASMAIFEAFDVPWQQANEARVACRVAAKLTGRRFSVLAKETMENGRPKTVQIKRVG